MTIASEDSKTGPYNGNGSTTVFAYDFKILDKTHLLVTLTDSDGNDTEQTLTTHYTVSGVGDVDGGNITMVTAPASGEKLTITRDVPATQGVDLQNRGGVAPETLEKALDQLTMLGMQHKEELGRAVKVSVSDTATDVATLRTNINNLAGIQSNISTVAGISANVTTVAGISANVTTVAGIDGNVSTVAGISANVTSVAGNATNINTTAGSISNVNTVGGIAADVTTVAGISSSVTAVASDASDIGTVATSIANVNTVAGIDGNVTTVAGISANVTTVAGISANVTTVAGVSSDVATVAGSISAVQTVADDLNEAVSEIDTVATNIANVNTVGGISANVTTVAGISGNVTAVAGISANVTTVAGISANVTTVAGISANVTTVAGVSANVATVATNITDVNDCATNMAAIQAAPTHATNAANSAAQAAASASEGFFSDVVAVAFADSPYTVASNQNGDLFKVDTSGGNVVINLPNLTNETDDFRCAIMKSSSDANTITVQRQGTDTINGNTSFTITAQYSGTNFTGDQSANEYYALDLTTGAALLVNNNLSDLQSASSARYNLGLVIGTDVESAQTAASQAEAEAGTQSAIRSFSPLRIAQAIAALAPSPATQTQGTWDAGTSTVESLISAAKLKASIDTHAPQAFASGTKMLFQQTAAPTGWTKDTTHNNKALRVVSGTAGSGGTTAFTTAFGTPAVSGTVSVNGAPSAGNLGVSMSGNVTVNNTTLSVNQIPSHRHLTAEDHPGYANHNVSANQTFSTNSNWSSAYTLKSSVNQSNPNVGPTSYVGNNGAHGHGASHNLTGNMSGAPGVGNLGATLSSATAGINVQYVDLIIATKD